MRKKFKPIEIKLDAINAFKFEAYDFQGIVLVVLFVQF
jgi:hypothetical protein